jgi:hypothetical protein
MGIKTLKTKLDDIFSLYIRLREATDEGLVQCFTCGKVRYFKDRMHCGHFQSRRHISTRFDEQNCQVQCAGCNWKDGEQFKFSLALDSKYGKGTAEDLLCKAIKTLKIMPHEYKEKISYYKSLVEKLLKEKGLSLKK